MLEYKKSDWFVRRILLMEEKIYKTMEAGGATSLAVGICVLVGGIAGGVLLIVHGAKLLKAKSKLMF